MIEFTVRGTPAPQGSKRHVGNGIMIESSAKVKPWRQDVRYAAEAAMHGHEPLDGPVNVTVDFYLQRPKSAPRTRRFPVVKPDIDKLIRSTLDALKSAGVYTDDSRVVGLTASKSYTDDAQPTSGAYIRVKEHL